MRKVRLRPAVMADLEIIREWHRAQNERDGTNYPLGLRFNKNGTLNPATPLALVGEEDGVAKGSLYCEKTAELQFAGCDPKMTAFSRRDIDAAAQVLYWQGYRVLHSFVPVKIVKSLQPPLEASGFTRVDQKFAHFFKELEG